ncbi:MAG: ABC transporter permease [Burkholderiaceae bacterium]
MTSDTAPHQPSADASGAARKAAASASRNPAPYDNATPDLTERIRPSRGERIAESAATFSPLVLLVLWEIVCRLGWLDVRFFPPPSAIAGTFLQDIGNGEIFTHVKATLWRVVVGIAMGLLPGVVLGLWLGLFKWPRLVLTPIFSTLYTVPKVAIFPLLLLIFGLGDASKFVLVAIGMFFLVFFSTLSGVLQIPGIYFDVARNAGATLGQTMRDVALPASLPSIFTGIKLGVGHAYVLIAASEFVGAKSGVGFYIWTSWQLFSISRMFVGIVLISLMGYLSMLLVEQIQQRLVPYAQRDDR